MKLKYTFEIIEMDQELVAVATGSHASEFHGLIRMNRSAADIFEILKEESTIDKIVDTLAAKYDTEREEIARQVIHHIENLREDGLLIE